jgi:hypothetical protein
MRPKAECTYCISQMKNLYPDQRKNRIEKYENKMLITVDTEKEFDYIETINYYMRQALHMYKELENYLDCEKS